MITPPRNYTAYELKKIHKFLFLTKTRNKLRISGILSQFQTLDKALV